MRALHPIMPFITEELWSKVPKSPLFADLISIMFAPYPRPDERYIDDEAESQMGLIVRVIRSIRDIRSTFSVPASAEVEILLSTENKDEAETLQKGLVYIQKDRTCRASKVTIATNATVPPRAATQMVASVKVIVPLGNVIDVEKAKSKLEQRQAAVEKDIEKVQTQLNNADFRARAPKEKVDGIEAQLADLNNQLESIFAQLKVLES
jgi:valyl-tRNA synthetase